MAKVRRRPIFSATSLNFPSGATARPIKELRDGIRQYWGPHEFIVYLRRGPRPSTVHWIPGIPTYFFAPQSVCDTEKARPTQWVGSFRYAAHSGRRKGGRNRPKRSHMTELE
jgi:hypothetical protein